MNTSDPAAEQAALEELLREAEAAVRAADARATRWKERAMAARNDEISALHQRDTARADAAAARADAAAARDEAVVVYRSRPASTLHPLLVPVIEAVEADDFDSTATNGDYVLVDGRAWDRFVEAFTPWDRAGRPHLAEGGTITSSTPVVTEGDGPKRRCYWCAKPAVCIGRPEHSTMGVPGCGDCCAHAPESKCQPIPAPSSTALSEEGPKWRVVSMEAGLGMTAPRCKCGCEWALHGEDPRDPSAGACRMCACQYYDPALDGQLPARKSTPTPASPEGMGERLRDLVAVGQWTANWIRAFGKPQDESLAIADSMDEALARARRGT